MATATEGDFKFGMDIHFAQRLAGNVTKIRERTVKKLKRWIAARSLKQGDAAMESELLRLWKGLFYCMWMCDKPVIQEEMADNIAELVHCFTTPTGALVFFDAFLLTMKREWVGIDRLRMDKFFMFVRRCLRQVLVVLRNNNWEDSLVDQFLAVLRKTPLSPEPEASPDGLCYHFVDIYREELARCDGQLNPSVQVMKLIDPFCVLVTSTHNKTLLQVILRGFFQEIIDESDVGFPEESEDEGIDSGEEGKAELDEDGEGNEENAENAEENAEENEEENGEENGEKEKKKYVQKERPKLKYDYEAIAARLFALASQQSTSGFVRRKVYAVVKKFQDLTEGVFPDYNVSSLVDYQDDEDEALPEKAKKPCRRGGQQARERRLAKAQQERARAAQHASWRFADEDNEKEWMEEGKEKKEENQKRKRRRRKKKQKLEKVVRGTDATEEKEMSEVEVGEKLNDGDQSSKQAETVGNKSDVPEDEAADEMDISEPQPSSGSDERDGGAWQKRGKKRKPGSDQDDAAAALDVGDAQTESVTAGRDEKSKMAAMQTAVTTETGSPLETQSASEQRSQSSKGTAGAGGVESDGASEVEGPIGPPKDKLQINLFRVGKLDRDSDEDISLQLGLLEPSADGKPKTEQVFAAFQKVSTPPALVRRKALSKERKAKSEPPRKTKSRLSGLGKESDSDQPTPRKRVKIALGLNQAHASKDYKRQLESSPGIPFDGSKKPTQSVLKTPSPKPGPASKKKTPTPTFKTPSPKGTKKAGVKSSSSKKRQSPKTAPNLRRSARLMKFIKK